MIVSMLIQPTVPSQSTYKLRTASPVGAGIVPESVSHAPSDAAVAVARIVVEITDCGFDATTNLGWLPLRLFVDVCQIEHYQI